MPADTGVYILEKGEEALIGRAWLAQHAARSIDIQYFIWSTDNIGILAAEQLLTAAERGVAIRVLVDDFLIDAEDETLLLLAAHPDVDIRIYNPNVNVGQGLLRKVWNLLTGFRAINQRMHDKTAIFDGLVGITGGRNMADEYFDYDHEYNFRDRDVLLLGAAVGDMQANFDEFWESPLSVPVEQLLEEALPQITEEGTVRRSAELHAYAADPRNFEPQVRDAIENMPRYFPALLAAMSWQPVEFISDVPGKNPGREGLGGGGVATDRLIEALRSAKSSVLIQSPYLVMPKGGIELLGDLAARGVRVRISTNSLASTDNIHAFSGYHRQRPRLLAAGVELYEYKPYPAIQAELVERYERLRDNDPVFAIHAKSMVIDDRLVYIGTFNLDPRSANLNTEVGALVESDELARQLSAHIERDVEAGNSWRTGADYNPDYEADRDKRWRLWRINLLPIEPLL
ncbi:MAG: phospholipase D family protein [Gammaproteobacteria bacterium]|nr:phospholipase D family protein [Gammaproteobacteria bacterium]MDH4254816.1 phospholipase D family protein [Gammaproteobacteria bacterium]MDH5309850.1 phospholipase D family protein [Gammaproteobacteria bacterium]